MEVEQFKKDIEELSDKMTKLLNEFNNAHECKDIYIDLTTHKTMLGELLICSVDVDVRI